MNIDLQQRGVEFSQLFGKNAHLREPLLEKMPPIQVNRVNGTSLNGVEELTIEHIPSPPKSNDTLLDLLGGSDDIIMPAPVPINNILNNNPTSNNQQTNLLDLLDIMEGDNISAPVVTTLTTNNNILTSPLSAPLSMSILDANDNSKLPEPSNFGLIDDGFGIFGGTEHTTTKMPQVKIITAFDKNDVLVQLATQKLSDYIEVRMTTTNNSLDTIDQYLFQVRSSGSDFLMEF